MSDLLLAGLTVLIAEDEPLIAMELEDLLTDHGATCLGPVGSISSALTLIAARPFDVALLDVNLRGERIDPVADCLATLGTPFLFTTGHGGDGLPIAHRHRLVIAKPFSASALVSALARHHPG
jgi:CheY-like chemotaxis protein